MSEIFVNENGFIPKTYEDNKLYYETKFQEIFGTDIDLDPLGPFGQFIGLLAKRDTDLWEGAEEIYNSRNPNGAIGVSLDNICAETGIIRQSEGKTQVLDVYLKGDIGTLIEAGKIAEQSESTDEVQYLLLNDVTISLSTVRKSILTVEEPGGIGELYTITLDSVAYSYTSIALDDAIDIATELKDAIEAGSFAGIVIQDNAELQIINISTDYTLLYTSNITLDELAAGGDFEADTAGAFPVPANSLDTIVTAVSGWNEVDNPSSGLTGRGRESDSDLRIRRANTLLTGNATDDAIAVAISNNVTGVSRVTVTSNRLDETSPDGLPPHSFEAVVVGGDDADIGQQIWLTQPSGIQSYGTESVIVVDSEGNNQTVYFSRPTAVYIWVKVKRDLYDEETYPADGDEAIKTAIVDWAAINQPIGKDVIRQRLSEPIYSVSGIEDIEVTIDDTATPGGTPVYAEKNISIASGEYADFVEARITVEDLTP
jgi:uncharacterized phage protein gp47/JayE